MKFISSSNNLSPIRSLDLARALSDPKVEGLARSMNLNLRDPVTLKKLLARAKHTLESSTEVSLSSESMLTEPEPSMESDIIPGQFIQHALRTYRSIASMR